MGSSLGATERGNSCRRLTSRAPDSDRSPELSVQLPPPPDREPDLPKCFPPPTGFYTVNDRTIWTLKLYLPIKPFVRIILSGMHLLLCCWVIISNKQSKNRICRLLFFLEVINFTAVIINWLLLWRSSQWPFRSFLIPRNVVIMYILGVLSPTMAFRSFTKRFQEFAPSSLYIHAKVFSRKNDRLLNHKTST